MFRNIEVKSFDPNLSLNLIPAGSQSKQKNPLTVTLKGFLLLTIGQFNQKKIFMCFNCIWID